MTEFLIFFSFFLFFSSSFFFYAQSSSGGTSDRFLVACFLAFCRQRPEFGWRRRPGLLPCCVDVNQQEIALGNISATSESTEED